MLVSMGLMILAGNTCYPVFLRLIIWALYNLLPDNKDFLEHKTTLRFMLGKLSFLINAFPNRINLQLARRDLGVHKSPRPVSLLQLHPKRDILTVKSFRPSQAMLHQSLSLKTYLVAFGNPCCFEWD